MLVTLGGKFHDQRSQCIAFNRSDKLVERPRIATKLDSAVLGIRAGDVQLISGDSLAFIKNLYGVLVVFTRISENVRDHNCIFDLA